MLDKCGCGRDGRYMDPRSGKMSCNKYARCPSYDELAQNTGDLFKDFIELANAFEHYTMYKEGTEHSIKAENKLKELKEKHNI